MKTVGLFEAKTKLSEICQTVAETGEVCTITKRGKPIVKILPMETDPEVTREIHNLSVKEQTMNLDELVEGTRDLPPDVVAELVDRIMLVRHGEIDPGIEEEWKQEVRRRLADHESGQGSIVSAEEMKTRLRSIR